MTDQKGGQCSQHDQTAAGNTYSFTSDETLSRFTVPYQTYLQRHPTVTYNSNEYAISAIASGAVVITTRALPRSAQPTVLLLRRAPTDSMPNLWEVPGGAVDAEDPSILYGVARELFEEAGLRASGFAAVVGPESGQVFATRRGLLVGKLHFLVEVDFAGSEDGQEGGVKLDENEHSDFCWATEDECRSGKVRRMMAKDGDMMEEVLEIPFTRLEQRAAVLEGFQVWRRVHGL